MMKTRRAYGLAAALVLFAAAALELGIIVAGYAWTRFSTQHNNIVSAVLAGFFVLAAIALLARGRSEGLARTAFALGVASTLALFAHALVGLAIVYLPVAFLQAFLLYNTFKGTRWERRDRMARERAHDGPEDRPRTHMRWT